MTAIKQGAKVCYECFFHGRVAGWVKNIAKGATILK